MHPAFPGLQQRDIHDLLGDALDLDIHLQSSHALLGTCHLEIHVAKVILVAQDVGKHGETVAFLDQAHRNARDMRLERYAGIHQREASTAYRSHRTRSIRLRNFGNQAHRVRKFLGRGQHREQGALGETTVSDFATFRRAHASRFTSRIRWEVVMQHESIGEFALQRVDALLVPRGTQRRDGQCLRFTSSKQHGAVRTRQYAGADRYWTHGTGVATVDAWLAVQDLGADDLGFDIAENCLHQIDVIGRRSLRHGFRHYLGACGIYFFSAGLFLPQSVSLAQFFFGQFSNPRDESRIFLQRRHIPQRLADFVGKLIDEINHRLHLLMAVNDCPKHDILRQFHCFRFDHQDCLAGTGDHQVELRGFQFGRSRIEDVFAIQISHSCGADRTVERDTGYCKRRGRADHRSDIRIHFAVGRDNGRDDLNFVVETFGEQRADGAVNQTAGQYFFF